MSAPAIICFGETLWDLLPSGHRPSGSPCRVALHLQQLGQAVRLISRVGDDELGHEMLAQLAAHGLDTDLVPLSATHLTGLVKTTEHGASLPRKKIVQPLAWDYIHYTDALCTAVTQSQLLVYGTLSARSPVSRETLYRLLPHAPFRVLNLELHPAHSSREVVKYLLKQADLLKCTETELTQLLLWHGQPMAAETALPWLAQRFGLRAVCLTHATGGASLYTDGKWWHSLGFGAPAEGGDGDAFLAALLAGWVGGQPPAECLRRACAASAIVAGQREAFAPVLTDHHLQLLLQSA